MTTNPTKDTIDLTKRLASHIWGLSSISGEADTRDVSVRSLLDNEHTHVWLVTSSSAGKKKRSFVIRLPNGLDLAAHRIRNEVGWLNYIRRPHPDIPVPEVYMYADGTDGLAQPPFIAEEYIEGERLLDVWTKFSEPECRQVCRNIAELIVRMGEVRFHKIGGMTPAGELGPTVETSKLSNGSHRFHDSSCYPIGPYDTTLQWVAAQYDKEIYYYEHADSSELDQCLFQTSTPAQLVQTLRAERTEALEQLAAAPNIATEPFVLCHEDLNSWHIIMRGTDIAAVVDWQFAGSYPLTELSSSWVEVFDCELGDVKEDELMGWGWSIREKEVPEIAKLRGWNQGEIDMLYSKGREVVKDARMAKKPPHLRTPPSTNKSTYYPWSEP